MKINKPYWLGLVLLAVGSYAQIITTPEGQESAAPAAPSFNKDRLIPIEMPKFVSLRFGIDPLTLSIGPDGVTRYVMVAINATGTATAMYEGIRCPRWEVKTYARYGANGQWSSVSNPEWRSMNDQPSRHAMAFARQGACQNGAGVPSSVAAILNTLKNPGNEHER
jgi:hypothetical protein